ncbi:MAG: translocation/assembly module TamB [Muribaculaceae bacterium]|nr:translocation/assembly module TamB [Muribaculaceae bacterium]
MGNRPGSVFKTFYKVGRSILFTLTLFVVGLFLAVYILLSLPPFTNYVKDLALEQLSLFLGSKVEVENLKIIPFNEVRLTGLKVYDPEGKECIRIETVGAGIRLWKLITEKKIELTYGEIIGLHGGIIQDEKDGPLNIQFIIDAFSGKEKKEKQEFELALHSVVLRKSSVSFSRNWMGPDNKIGKLDLSHIEISDLAADITFPKISDKGIDVDLRRLSLSMPGLTEIDKIALRGSFGSGGIFIKDLEIEFPSSRIFIPLIEIPLNEGENLADNLKNNPHSLEISGSYINPSDFSFLLPALGKINEPLPLDLIAEGTANNIDIDKFLFGNPSVALVKLSGKISSLSDIKNLYADIDDFEVEIPHETFSKILPGLEQIPDKVSEILSHTGNLSISGNLIAAKTNDLISGHIEVFSDIMQVIVDGGYNSASNDTHEFSGEVNIEKFMVDRILPEIPIGDVRASLQADGGIKGKDPFGSLSLIVDNIEFRNNSYNNISLDVEKNMENISGNLNIDNRLGKVDAIFSGDISPELMKIDLECDLADLNLSDIVDMKGLNGYLFSGNLDVKGEGTTIDDIIGSLFINDLTILPPADKKPLILHQLSLQSELQDNTRLISLDSDWIEGTIEGTMKFKGLAAQVVNLVDQTFPAFVESKEMPDQSLMSDLDFQFNIKLDNTLTEYFNLPIRLLVPVSIDGALNGADNTANLAIDIPYLQQGKDKLISDSRVFIDFNGNEGEMDLQLATTFPIKKGELQVELRANGENNKFTTDINWINTENSDFRGLLGLTGEVKKNPLSSKPQLTVDFRHSVLDMGEAEWIINPARITYCDKRLEVDGLKLWHDEQFVEIDGVASEDYSDALNVRLADIDVDYIFDTLKINYVTFGGVATGEVTGRSLFSKDPVAETERLKIINFSYNGAQIGECYASSRWNNSAKEIEISADIFKESRQLVKANGGIWLGKDSLAFQMNADKVPVEFIQPFMAAFSSHVGGIASGDLLLFGTFKDIDMTGKIFADSVAVKLDYTNTVYHGSDSVILNRGKIDIPGFRLYDKNGNSALLTGELTHRYFHDPSFTFRLSDATDFLCYDTSSEINPDWYGQLYGSGSAFIRGIPGFVDISADMTLVGNSSFTFVLDDRQYAQDYQFLTFSDRRKEAAKAVEKPEELDFKSLFKKKVTEQNNESMSKFGLDIRATVTPAVLFTLVMDPAAGDKITARGRGAMQVKYESDNDEMQLYGKYEIDEGNYNFSLQDIILRDFKIKEGSSISFNGDPLRADLDISAAYRVNTNLSDLDKSFQNDRDLTRTNVPVDAILSVSGNMQDPDITFDIELPTLTQDVERKVKSIISTDDMMNRQIIYLLALNRFYTPEYMGMSGNGGELAAVASSTISSQLTNMLGQLTDKVSVAPSFRSDKGDFSDIEVDVALSSRLLNNRLLINGNFGYRDKSTSNTTFIGDFDIEYLLTKNGNLRLKAYNHFNDQNYYLREALTTQGLGVVFRKDFDKLFGSRKEEKEKDEEEIEEAGASSEENKGEIINLEK